MLDIMKKAAIAAGEIQKKYFRQTELDVVHKTNHENIVTIADHESQKIIHDFLLKSTDEMGIDPDTVGFIGEEDLRSTGKHMFVVDPLDGTSNFATGTEEFGVLIAYFYKGELKSGVMYFPMKKMMYSSEIGKGVTLEKDGISERIALKKIPLQDCFLLSSMSYQDEIESGMPEKIISLKPLFRAVRMYGCIGNELGYILQGIAGATLAHGCSIWDIAPGILMLREVGYEMYDMQGNPIQLDLLKPKKTYPFLACHPSNKAILFDKIS